MARPSEQQLRLRRIARREPEPEQQAVKQPKNGVRPVGRPRKGETINKPVPTEEPPRRWISARLAAKNEAAATGPSPTDVKEARGEQKIKRKRGGNRMAGGRDTAITEAPKTDSTQEGSSERPGRVPLPPPSPMGTPPSTIPRAPLNPPSEFTTDPKTPPMARVPLPPSSPMGTPPSTIPRAPLNPPSEFTTPPKTPPTRSNTSRSRAAARAPLTPLKNAGTPIKQWNASINRLPSPSPINRLPSPSPIRGPPPISPKKTTATVQSPGDRLSHVVSQFKLNPTAKTKQTLVDSIEALLKDETPNLMGVDFSKGGAGCISYVHLKIEKHAPLLIHHERRRLLANRTYIIHQTHVMVAMQWTSSDAALAFARAGYTQEEGNEGIEGIKYRVQNPETVGARYLRRTSSRLCISNMSPAVSDETLLLLFSSFGLMQGTLPDREKDNSITVKMDCADSADVVFDVLNGEVICGQVVVVEHRA